MLRVRAPILKVPAAARLGATLSETLLAGAAIGLLLLVAALGVEQVRTEFRIRQTRQLLVLLRSALLAYQQSTGTWPEPAEPPPQPPPGGPTMPPEERDAVRMAALLWAHEASRERMEGIPPLLRTAADPRDRRDSRSSDPGVVLRDSWGTPLWCLTAGSPAQVQREAVAANGGCPIFISAGQDRDFGVVERSAGADNLRSDELPPATRPE